MAKLEIVPSSEFSAVVAEHTVLAAKQAIAERGHFLWVLTGGSTPGPIYSLLATPAFQKRIDWERTHIFWGDERCVPPNNEASNYLMAYNALLKNVPIPAQNIHRMPGELNPSEGAVAHEHHLRDFFKSSGSELLGEFPRFDLVHLGMGSDGHVASLFPDDALLQEKKLWIAATGEAKNGERRLTFTFPALNAAREVAFLVAGEGKAKMVKQVLDPTQTVKPVPAQLIAPLQGNVVFFADVPAARGIADVSIHTR